MIGEEDVVALLLLPREKLLQIGATLEKVVNLDGSPKITDSVC